MSYVGIKKSYVGIIKQQSTTPVAAVNTMTPAPESSGGGGTQIGVGNVFTTVVGKKRNLFGLDEEGKRMYSPAQIGIGLAGRAVGAGLGAWNAARTLSESQGGDMISDLGRAGIAGQQTMNLGTAATNAAMDAPGKIAGMPKTISNYRNSGKNTTSGFEEPEFHMGYPVNDDKVAVQDSSMEIAGPAEPKNPVKVVTPEVTPERVKYTGEITESQ